jgi:hypothetical protein
MDHSKMDEMKMDDKIAKKWIILRKWMEWQWMKRRWKNGSFKMKWMEWNEKIRTCRFKLTNVKSQRKTNLPKDAPIRELHFDLNGNMNSFEYG